MASPLPGMDPYLETDAIWPSFHHHLINSLFQILLPNLVDRYRARVCTRRYTTETPLFTSIIREDQTEELIEIRTRSDSRLVALIDVVGPINKKTPQGREAYLAQRREARRQHASIVEIDLCMQGPPILEYSRDGLPKCDYAVTVMRSTQPERYEVYRWTIQDRLKRFKLPLAPDDRDVVVDLATAMNRAYDNGSFANLVDYSKDPEVVADENDLLWIHGALTAAKIRGK